MIDFFIGRERQRQSRELTLTRGAFEKLFYYSFPGNVRELENILERAAIFSNGSMIKEEDIVFPKVAMKPKVKYRTRYSFDKIIDTLVKHKGNKTKTAQALGVSRVHLYRILNELRK